MTNKQIALMGCLLAFGLGSAYAEPTITGMKASPARAQTKAAVKVVIRGNGLEDAICALRVNFGDGSATVREMDWSKKVRFPIAVKKSYARPGKYRISVVGTHSGMYLKCLGSATTTVTVVAPPPK